jgi:hypothetical protein
MGLFGSRSFRKLETKLRREEVREELSSRHGVMDFRNQRIFTRKSA